MNADDEGNLGTWHGVTIRDMEIGDLANVYHLGKHLFSKTTFPVLYRTWDPYEVTYYYTSDPEFCLVAESSGGDVAGFALGSTVDKDDGSWRSGYLAWLGVKPEYQHAGVGRRLLKEFEKRMKEDGVRILLVDTEGENVQALGFFRKHGFNHPITHVWLTKTLSKRGPMGVRASTALKRRGHTPAANGGHNGRSHSLRPEKPTGLPKLGLTTRE